MDYGNPTLLVISGPNGAGKSTHIRAMLPEAFSNVLPFDRDKTRTVIEAELKMQSYPENQLFKLATNRMEEVLKAEMLKAIQSKSHFVLETPLSHPDYWRYIDLFERNNYQIQLCYLCLDKINDCTGRVSQRVSEGGHFVPPDTIKGVYQKNLEHINSYHGTFKIIELYDGMKSPTLLAKFEDGNVVAVSEVALKKQWITKGLPVLGQKIKDFVHENTQKNTQRRKKGKRL